jgi:hypothetical protein
VSHTKQTSVDGRPIPKLGAVVILAGVGFLAMVTAPVTASLVEGSRPRFAARSKTDATRRLDDVRDRLARIEAALDQPGPRRS